MPIQNYNTGDFRHCRKCGKRLRATNKLWCSPECRKQDYGYSSYGVIKTKWFYEVVA